MVMSLKELDEQLKSAEEEVVSSLEEYKNAKATLRKARITSISTKLLAPFRRFRIEQAIAKYDAMIEKLEKKREKEIRRAEKLQEKEVRLERKQAKADFKVAIRDKRKEDIVNFVNDRKDDVINFVDDKKSDVINFGREISSEVSDTFSYIREIGASRVSSASSFVGSVKNSAIKKVQENTKIDLIIKNAIEDIRLRQYTNKVNREYEKGQNALEAARLEKINSDIKHDEEIKASYKERDVPFSNINEKIQEVSMNNCYIGRATNKAVDYIKEKYWDFRVEKAVVTHKIGGYISSKSSKLFTVFNNQLNNLESVLESGIDKMSDGIDFAKNRLEERKVRIAESRKESERELAIKEAQRKSMEEALRELSGTDDIFANAPSLEVGRTR